MVTIKDVAKKAGVSTATVSCCLSNAKNVRPSTKEKVMTAIAELKYIPNTSARNLKSSTGNVIGMIFPHLDYAYYTELLKGLSDSLQQKGYIIHVAFSNNQPELECKKIEEFTSSNVSGLIIITCQPENTDFFQTRILDFAIPVVFMEHRPVGLNSNFIGYNNDKTIQYMTEKLLEKNYHKIALVSGNTRFSCEKDCQNGYRRAFFERGIKIDENLLIQTNMTKEDTFRSILQNPSLSTIEAVITTSENIRLGVLEAMHLHGKSLIKDVLLLSLGEEHWNLSCYPKDIIFSCRTPYSLGITTTELLLDNITNHNKSKQQNLLFTDEIVHKKISIPKKTNTSTPKINTLESPLRILMPDIATSHAIKILSPYFTKDTGIPVTVEILPQDLLLTEIRTDSNRHTNKYDIYAFDSPQLEYMVQHTFIANIHSFIKENSFINEAFFDQNMESCCYKNEYYGIPIIGGAQLLFYRKDYFEDVSIQSAYYEQFHKELQPPKDWAEFNQIARFFTKKYNSLSPTEYGTSLAGNIDEALAPELLLRIWNHGGQLWDVYTRASLNTPNNITAFKNICDTFKYTEQLPFFTSINRTVSDFATGQTAMLITYTEYANEISKHMPGNHMHQVGYQLIPGQISCNVGWNLGVHPDSLHTESALAYFKWISKKETSFYMTLLDGQSPVIDPYHSYELLKLYPWLELTEKSFQFTRKRNGPCRPNALVVPQNEIEHILCQVLKDILIQKMPIELALQARQKDMELLFQSYGYPKPLHFL
ncbi:MAG: extracellular solute-binding protein [Eubacteriales bacterium]